MPLEHAPAIAWRAVGPVLTLIGGAIITLTAGAINRRVRRDVLAAISLASIAASGYLTYFLARHRHFVALQGMVAVDGVTLFTTMILLFTATLVVLMSYQYLSDRRIHRFEYYPLLLLATAGMILLASANDLILIFISLEVLSLALYIMVGFARRDAGAQEGSLKYFLLGAFSSAILLYGLALAFGATGSTNLARISVLAGAPQTDARLMLAATALLGVGFAFKVAAVPFHMWTPDAYQGAPTSVTGFMAAGTKAAAFAAFLRVFLVALGTLRWDWRPALWFIAIVTMVVGSLVAIVQSDVKRMLAYSSIAHAGFILVGLVAANRNGIAGALFYLLVYSIMVLGAFGAVTVSAPRGAERLDFSSWVGLGQRHPAFAGAMTLFLLALAGIPPTAGFMGKFFVFQAAIQAGETGLVVAGVLTTVIAAFFYLRLIVVMWLQEPSGDVPGLGLSPAASVGLAMTAAATVALGIYPQGLIHLARTAAFFTG
jgi:NADH-quinone oxidoreductase subunit N